MQVNNTIYDVSLSNESSEGGDILKIDNGKTVDTNDGAQLGNSDGDYVVWTEENVVAEIFGEEEGW